MGGERKFGECEWAGGGWTVLSGWKCLPGRTKWVRCVEVKLQDPHLFAKWYVSASFAFAGLLQPAEAGKQGGVIGMSALPNSLSQFPEIS
jgi:hypothetical protein